MVEASITVLLAFTAGLRTGGEVIAVLMGWVIRPHCVLSYLPSFLQLVHDL